MICNYCNTKSKKFVELPAICCKSCWNSFVNLVYEHLKVGLPGVYSKGRDPYNLDWPSVFDVDNHIYQCKNGGNFDCAVADAMSDLVKQTKPASLMESLTIINNIKVF